MINIENIKKLLEGTEIKHERGVNKRGSVEIYDASPVIKITCLSSWDEYHQNEKFTTEISCAEENLSHRDARHLFITLQCEYKRRLEIKHAETLDKLSNLRKNHEQEMATLNSLYNAETRRLQSMLTLDERQLLFQ
jgi:hypothetical protein